MAISIVNNLLANQVQFNLDENESALKNITDQLSSGLRINSAADDPSGLAISTNLQTQADGFSTAIDNVQTANNATQVALGAFTTTTDILQRIRSLAVEAASDISSPSDRENLQAEVTQLLLEVNRVSQNTNFNGQPLLDGSHAGFQTGQNAYGTVTANTILNSNGSLIAAISASALQFNTTAGGVQGVGGTGTHDGTIELIVVNTGTSIAVQETFIESSTGQVYTSPSLFGPNAPHTGKLNPLANINGTGATGKFGFDNVAIVLGAFTTADVGATAYVKISQNVAALTNPSNPAFTFQSGADEGDVIQVGIQATNTQTLRISNVNLAISSSNNASLGAEDAIGQVDLALRTLLGQQALLGAVVVRLNEDANNDSVSATNLQASESSIRDLNVGQATTEFTKLQILVQVGTSVLAQSNSNAESVAALFK